MASLEGDRQKSSTRRPPPPPPPHPSSLVLTSLPPRPVFAIHEFAKLKLSSASCPYPPLLFFLGCSASLRCFLFLVVYFVFVLVFFLFFLLLSLIKDNRLHHHHHRRTYNTETSIVIPGRTKSYLQFNCTGCCSFSISRSIYPFLFITAAVTTTPQILKKKPFVRIRSCYHRCLSLTPHS